MKKLKLLYVYRSKKNIFQLAFEAMILLVMSLTLINCKKAVNCQKFRIEKGTRMGYSSFPHPDDTAYWSECTDKIERKLRCTSAHLSNWICYCSDSTDKKLTVRMKEGFPDDTTAATLFGNKYCQWRFEYKAQRTSE